VSQEERSIFSKVTIGHFKRKSIYVHTRALLRTVSEIELFNCAVPKLLIRMRYYILFLIPVFIVYLVYLV
jgi:hypothetical protein